MSFLVIYCCVKNCRETKWLKTTILLYLMILWVRNLSGHSWWFLSARWHWLSLSGIWVVGGLLWGGHNGFLWISGTILEMAGRLGSARAVEKHASAWHLNHVSLRGTALLAWKLAFPRVNIPMDPGRNCKPSCDLALEVPELLSLSFRQGRHKVQSKFKRKENRLYLLIYHGAFQLQLSPSIKHNLNEIMSLKWLFKKSGRILPKKSSFSFLLHASGDYISQCH